MLKTYVFSSANINIHKNRGKMLKHKKNGVEKFYFLKKKQNNLKTRELVDYKTFLQLLPRKSSIKIVTDC